MTGRHWTPAEEKYLVDSWGLIKIQTISKKLNRTSFAISQKAYRMGLQSMADNIEGIAITELPDLIGVSYCNIYKTWIQDNGMRTRLIHKSLAIVTDEELSNFMQSHPNLWVPSKCDKVYFSEHEWFVKALEDEYNGIIVKNRKEWTIAEIHKMKILRMKGYTFKQIGNQLGRSKSSCTNKYRKYYGFD